MKDPLPGGRGLLQSNQDHEQKRFPRASGSAWETTARAWKDIVTKTSNDIVTKGEQWI